MVIGQDTNLQEMLRKWPYTRVVLERRGLLGCGGEKGPDERVDLFAKVHRVNLDELLDELNAVALGGISVQPTSNVKPLSSTKNPGNTTEQPSKQSYLERIYLPFVLTAIVSVVVAGALSGAIFLTGLRLGSFEVSVFQKQAHARIQIFGFVLPMIMGIGFHALPRFIGTPLQVSRLLSLSPYLLWILLPFLFQAVFFPEQFGLRLVSAIVNAVLAGLFCGVIFRTVFAIKQKLEPYLGFILLGTVGWGLAGIFDLASSVAFFAGRQSLGLGLTESLYAVAIYGAILPWTLGMFLRVTAMFMGLRDINGTIAYFCLSILAVGSALLFASHLPMVVPSQLLATVLAKTLIILSVSIFIVACHVWEKSTVVVEKGDFAFPMQVRVAFIFLGLSMGFSLLWCLGSITTFNLFPAFLMDAERHALLGGYLLLLVTAMAGRILPVFSGKKLRLASVFIVGNWLIAIGVTGRICELFVTTIAWEILMAVVTLSGYLMFVGLFFSLLPIALTLVLPAMQELKKSYSLSDEPTPDWVVSDLLQWHPNVIDILVDAGFGALRNPLLRKTLAHSVTLRQASAIHKKNADELVRKIRGLRG